MPLSSTPSFALHRSAAPLVMIIGDSFTVGSGPVGGWDSYAAQAARAMGWQLVTAGASGTGFVNPGSVGRTFETSFDKELSWRPPPSLLIISGGHNDREVSPGTVHQAVERLLELVGRRWPRTRVVVIGPIWMAKAPEWSYQVRDAIAVAAEEAKTPFLDPLGRSWGSGATLSDGVHPTYEGHTKIAQWLVGGLRKYGFGPSA
ncbi:SGNH/GDSL hydrolase family protein [Streptosporangium lutulentum]|uniref:Lysophospholipase L1-like esterase n=1 Tax=Streptosporangium lutulentum TaxID=1461250 RepID=A0ABT9QKZ3_9ACTN|nr:SGNH/GDSL hydrolase family protein [Streptosporangium lutulentum]MDP9846933.1 lysophospholipase L1-like esterase [Streptosporangium lutulentum]